MNQIDIGALRQLKISRNLSSTKQQIWDIILKTGGQWFTSGDIKAIIYTYPEYRRLRNDEVSAVIRRCVHDAVDEGRLVSKQLSPRRKAYQLKSETVKFLKELNHDDSEPHDTGEEHF